MLKLKRQTNNDQKRERQSLVSKESHVDQLITYSVGGGGEFEEFLTLFV